MRATFHIVMILLIGVTLGLVIRSFRSTPRAGGPGPGETVFSNDGPGDLSEEEMAAISNPDPSHPTETLISKFELIERSGETVNSDQLLGHPYVVSFFFSTCPGKCTQQNQKLKKLQDEFDGRGVRFVSISVDPETDTPEALREYAARFGADENQWLFMTGDLLAIRQLGTASYHQPVDLKFHTDKLILVDARGEVEGWYSWEEEVQLRRLQERIVEMLDQRDVGAEDS